MMGIAEDASPKEMKQQYQRLMTALFALDTKNPKYEDRLRRAREKLSDAYEATKRLDLRRGSEFCAQSTEQPTSDVPGIGELLVEAGVIARTQLEAALEAQMQSPVPVPIGRLFVHWRLITWNQLAFYLRVQDLLELDPHSHERLSRQLLDLGLLTADEIEMVELDCETVGCSFEHAICRRGWVKPELLKKLTAFAHMRTVGAKMSLRMVPQTPKTQFT